jgi:hypothetical protein
MHIWIIKEKWKKKVKNTFHKKKKIIICSDRNYLNITHLWKGSIIINGEVLIESKNANSHHLYLNSRESNYTAEEIKGIQAKKEVLKLSLQII